MNTELQRSPIYQQLNQRLRSALSTEFDDGDKFLSEREVSRRFSVSRTTANKALASLVSEGLLEFRRGIGTFVSGNRMNYDVRSLVSFVEKAKTAGRKPMTKLLHFEKVSANEMDTAVSTSLGLAPDDLAWSMKRLRLADGVPLILEQRFVVHSACPKLQRRQASGSLYSTWTTHHGLEVAGAEELIRAINLSKSEAALLDVPSKSSAFEVVAVGYHRDAMDQTSPLWWERTLYRGDQYEFTAQLGPLQKQGAPHGALRLIAQ